jgi:hypothetical protein
VEVNAVIIAILGKTNKDKLIGRKMISLKELKSERKQAARNNTHTHCRMASAAKKWLI